ncbi:MAG: hypothetical protein EOO59_06520 [Hymenobacter sp.]|nr:MAG: hypothetical protein EOO59_06520 [Hymenobacter sp.]
MRIFKQLSVISYQLSAVLLILVVGCHSSSPVPPLRISIVGDVLLARGVPAALARDSAALRATTRRLWAGSRYVIGNLECPLTDTARPAAKAIVFRGKPPWASWLRSVGFTHVSLANNHTLDQHWPGLRATARAGRAARLGLLGYQPDSLVGCLPTVLGRDSSVAVFAYSALRQGIAGEGCVCGRAFAALCERVAAYKTLFPERAVLVYVHWGTEYAAQPSAGQRQQAHDLLDAGAAAVVGAHPHVVQPVEFYRGRPIVYSLGNFLFDQRGGETALAAQVDLTCGGAGWSLPISGRCAWQEPLRSARLPQPARWCSSACAHSMPAPGLLAAGRRAGRPGPRRPPIRCPPTWCRT